jgi:hypothetical protein
MCVCGHPAHHHVQGYCVTVTVTGPASEVHGDRTETMCDCELLTPAALCGKCHHPRHNHHMDYGRCDHPIGTVWLCGCPHYESKDQ